MGGLSIQHSVIQALVLRAVCKPFSLSLSLSTAPALAWVEAAAAQQCAVRHWASASHASKLSLLLDSVRPARSFHYLPRGSQLPKSISYFCAFAFFKRSPLGWLCVCDRACVCMCHGM